MTRILPLCAAFLTLPVLGRSDEAPAPAETVIRLKVQAAGAPKPALRYLLLPELREMNPGNPIQAYMKCFAEQNHFFHSKVAQEEREKWETMPLADLPVEKLRNYGGIALRQADYAARLDTPDWQTLLKLKSDGIFLLLPEVQQMRLLAWGLKVRLRGEIADRRFDDALVTAKTMFALARHLGEHPTLIGNLVGISIAISTVEPLEETLQQPGCPNLFWALTDLPRPFIDLRRGAQGERMMLMTEFAMLDEKAAMTRSQLQKAVNRFRALSAGFNKPGPKEELDDWLAGRTKDEAHLRAARKRLMEYGLAEDVVTQFPSLQVVLLDAKLRHEVLRDETMKGLSLPYWQAAPIFAAIRKSKEELPFPPVLSIVKVRQAQARLEQRLALLRCVEALRLYAAKHDGKLPAQLADVKLPLSVDPFTGKAFLYKLEGATATVRGTPPQGLERLPIYNIRYAVSIRK